MIPSWDCSASQKRGRRYGPGAVSIDTPVLGSPVRLRAIEPEQPQSGYRAAEHPKFAAYAGSRLASLGASPAAVQRILRHSDISVTMDVYGHLAPGYLRDEMNRLSFRPKTDGFTSPVLWRERFSRSPPARTSRLWFIQRVR